MRLSPLQIVIRSGKLAGLTVPIDRPLLLGRDPRSRIVFEDPQISRLHALIEVDTEGVKVRDLGSRNGLYLNNERLEGMQELHEGDQIRLGSTVLSVESVAPATPAGYRREDSSGEPAAPTISEDRFPTPMNADLAALEAEQPSSSVRLNQEILRRALSFASQSATVTEPAGIREWLLPRLVLVFRSAGGVLIYGAEAPPNRAMPRFDSSGNELAAQFLAPLPWNRLATLRTVAQSNDFGVPTILQVLGLPLRDSDDAVIAYLVLWRAGEPMFSSSDERLAVAIAEAIANGPIPGVIRRVMAGHGAAPPPELNLGFIGDSPGIAAVRDSIQRSAITDATVLITGESGTGKEVTARALWQQSRRSGHPFIAINMAAIPHELMEAELFGYERGAFTGAMQARPGKLELASGGTLFLDEIGDLPLDLQVKLLRVLEGQPFFRLGGSRTISADVRFICATNQDLEDMVEEGTFRKDLFHRMNILRIQLPPLREHLEDVPALLDHYIEEIRRSHSLQTVFKPKPTLLSALMRYDWPGNVREFRNVVERMILLADSPELHEGLIPEQLRPRDPKSTDQISRLHDLTMIMERDEVMRALIEAGGRKSKAASLLGISRPTLDRKIRLYSLERLARTRAADEPEKESKD